jgi:hypothetical protein
MSCYTGVDDALDAVIALPLASLSFVASFSFVVAITVDRSINLLAVFVSLVFEYRASTIPTTMTNKAPPKRKAEVRSAKNKGCGRTGGGGAAR